MSIDEVGVWYWDTAGLFAFHLCAFRVVFAPVVIILGATVRVKANVFICT